MNSTERLVTNVRHAKLEDYLSIAGEECIQNIRSLAESLRGRRIQHINTSSQEGGVAEILTSLVPLLNQLGLKTEWYVMEVNPEFAEVTKRFHNIFHGLPLSVTRDMYDVYLEGVRSNQPLIDPAADFVVLHDPQPLGLAEVRPRFDGHWIWYCHVDPVEVGITLWEFLRPFAASCDASIYHMAEYSRRITAKDFYLPPAVDPLSEKNREISPEEQAAILSELGIETDLPIILQVSRFDRLKNPVGLVEAFRQVVRRIPCRLILAGGGAEEDPEVKQVLAEVKAAAADHPDIKILFLSPSSHLQINALQRAAAIVVQNSFRDSFGLTVTEALWKQKPVVASPVGGIRRQVIDYQTGLLAAGAEVLANRISYLLNHPDIGQELGIRGKEYVRSQFILPVYLRTWLVILREILK